ncbi:14-3-3-like protein 1 [Mya arenaria]|uniref:14-3-3-like protein 1 n=1 Tax=Mya arenaria TaxID=6604 RepID=UPI0022E80FD7|nr:14-3-3-like protein 1 [Mya arenaria]
MAREIMRTKAKWCEHAERYDDMVNEMKALVDVSSKDEPLDEEERNLLSVAYKNVVGGRRSSWRVLNAKFGEDLKERQRALVEAMKKKVEDELVGLCSDVIRLLDDRLILQPENVQAKIFFLKMKGDYHRYMVEIAADDAANRETLIKTAEKAYQEAMDIATEKLPSTSPIRLGLALNYSVFFYEIKSSPNEACDLAKKSFDEAIEGLENVSEDVYKDSTLIMQLLRDNLTLWRSELDDDEEQQDTGDD